MRLFFLICLFLMTVQEASAKKKRKKKSRKPPFTAFRIVDEELKINDSPELTAFFKNLNQLKEGKRSASVFILGDSHQQCEDFGHALQDYLNDSAGIPSAGRCFAFPYPFARTSQRSPMRFSCKKNDWKGCRITNPLNSCMWGICGWQASSDADSLHFSWKAGEEHFREADEVGILSPPESRRHALFLKDSLFNMEIPYDENRNGFFIRLPANQSQLHFSVRRSDSTAFHHQGFVRVPSKEGLSLGISGTNGARLDHYLLSRDFEENLRAIHPDLVVLALGTNDAFGSPFDKEKVRLHLGMLVARIRMALPEAAILLIGPPDHCSRRMKINANTLKINEIYAEMAEELELGFWNLQHAMGGEKSAFAWRRKKLITTDMVHFTVDGYRLQAKMLGKALHKAMQSIQVE